MFKNISLGQVTLVLTLFMVVINAACLIVILMFSGWSGISLWWTLGVLITSLVLTFLFVKSFLEYFVLRKIRLIYKMISDSKQIKSLKGLDSVKEESFKQVTDEVVKWAEKRENEIDTLNKLEQYRRSFVGNLSHELKTPIFSIQGYIHTLLEGGIHDDAINMKYLERAAKNLERLQNIADDLEKINQLQTGTVSLKLEQFDLKELAKEVNQDLDFMAKDIPIQIKLKSGASQNFKVTGDREKIRQVLQNLIGNAIKYGSKGGTVTVGFYDLDEKVLIEVEDDGAGIQEKHLNHLFDRFYRVDEGRSRKHGGSGLGLAIVKHIIEAHDQTISVRSTVGEGSTFGFTLANAG